MKKIKTKLAGIIFIASLAALVAITGACEENSISLSEYIVYSAITLAVFLWSGVKGELLHK